MNEPMVFRDEISCRTFMDEQERTNTGWHTPIMLETATQHWVDGFVTAQTWQKALQKFGKLIQDCDAYPEYIPCLREFYRAHQVGDPGSKQLSADERITFVVGQVSGTADEWYIKIVWEGSDAKNVRAEG